MKPLSMTIVFLIFTSCGQEPPQPEIPKCIVYHFADGLHITQPLHESCYEGESGEIITKIATWVETEMQERTFAIKATELEEIAKLQNESDALTHNYFWDSRYRRIERILTRLKPYTERKDINYSVNLVEHRKVPRKVSAWTNANGSIQITTAMLEFVGSDNELAFVIAHEVSHCENWCADQRLAIDKWVQEKTLSFFDLGFSSNSIDYILPGLNQYNEIKADRAALYLMNEAGYDPEKALDLFTRLDELLKEERGNIFFNNFLSSHPYNSTRYDCLNRYLRESKQQLEPCLNMSN